MIELHKKHAIISFSQPKIIEFYEIMETESKTQDYNGCPDKYITRWAIAWGEKIVWCVKRKHSRCDMWLRKVIKT